MIFVHILGEIFPYFNCQTPEAASVDLSPDEYINDGFSGGRAHRAPAEMLNDSHPMSTRAAATPSSSRPRFKSASWIDLQPR